MQNDTGGVAVNKSTIKKRYKKIHVKLSLMGEMRC